MCILQGFSRLIVGFDVQDWFPWESLSVENYCFKERFHCLIFRQWTLLWDGIFFNKSCWNLWIFLLCTLAVIMCISLLLFREHGEIYYFLSIIHKLLLLLIIAIIIIAFEVRERNPQFLWGVQCIIWVSCAINKRGFSRLYLCRHTFASLWGACLRFASLWRTNSHGYSCVLGVHLSDVCWAGLHSSLKEVYIPSLWWLTVFKDGFFPFVFLNFRVNL